MRTNPQASRTLTKRGRTLVGLWLIMILIALYQVPRLIREQQRRTLLVFSVLWVLATVYGSLVLEDVPVPRPTDLIYDFFSMFTR